MKQRILTHFKTYLFGNIFLPPSYPGFPRSLKLVKFEKILTCSIVIACLNLGQNFRGFFNHSDFCKSKVEKQVMRVLKTYKIK